MSGVVWRLAALLLVLSAPAWSGPCDRVQANDELISCLDGEYRSADKGGLDYQPNYIRCQTERSLQRIGEVKRSPFWRD